MQLKIIKKRDKHKMEAGLKKQKKNKKKKDKSEIDDIYSRTINFKI